MSFEKELQQQQKLLREVDQALYGFDTSRLSWSEKSEVDELLNKRLELQALHERKNPKPAKKLTKGNELKKKKMLLRLAQIQNELKSMDAQAELYERGR
jgi:hypothetical protein